MTDITIYGIKNCDTMKKALNWLDENGRAFTFHDYKKHGAELNILQRAFDQHGWEQAINRRGTSWRKLPDDAKSQMNAASALQAAKENPSLIKRPLLVYNGRIFLGFSDAQYTEIFSD